MIFRLFWRRVAAWLALSVIFWFSSKPCVAETREDFFEVLQIGTVSFTNATVTTKARDYIFLLHAGGMANVKVSELSPELKATLGYAVAVEPKPNAAAEKAKTLAKETLQKIETPQVRELERQIRSAFGPETPAAMNLSFLAARLGPAILWAIAGIMVVLHLFFSYCSFLICRKCGSEASILVWLPVLQIFPLLKAARMSSWWFLACIVPLVNVIAQIVWCVKITEARGKNILVAIGLMLPITNVFAFLYLAFSGVSVRTIMEGAV